jgi:glycosyltransferase involved in cell wall biosynthesis
VKILLVSRGVFPVPVKYGAGAEVHMYNLANAIASLGHEVHYVTNIFSRKGFHKNIILHTTKSSSLLANKTFYAWTICYTSGNFKSFKEALRVLKNENYSFDVIHSHGNLSSLLLSRMKKTIPLIYTAHDIPPYSCRYSSSKETIIRHLAFQSVELETWRGVDHLIAVSQKLKEEMMKKRIPDEKISVIYNGVDSKFLKENDYKTSLAILQNKYDIANHYCLFVGRLTPRKGVNYLLYALKKTDNIQCVIVGDGPQRKYLLSLTKNIGLQERVTFTGYVPQEDLKHLYTTADFFVLPSLAEGLPLVILEALATGTPVIASRVAGIPDIISDGYNGLMFPPGDVDALAKTMQKLAYDPALREKMSFNARRTVDERFSWKNVAKEVLRVYDKVCS